MTRRKGAAVLGAALLLALLANEFVVVGVKSAATADDGSKQTRRVRSQSAHLASLVRVVRGAVALCETFLDECWLDSGTLLGARRSGRVLRWDEDGDLGVSRAAHLKLSALSAAKLDAYRPKIAGGHAPWTYCAQALKAPTKDRGGEFRSGMTDAREKAIARDISNIFCG